MRGLRFAPLSARVAAAVQPDLVAELKSHGSPSGVTCWLAPRDAALAINGLAPLPLAALEPGDLLAVGPQHWFVAALWAAEPQPAPEALTSAPVPSAVVRWACAGLRVSVRAVLPPREARGK